MSELKHRLEELFSETQRKVLSIILKNGTIPYDLTVKPTEYFFHDRNHKVIFETILKSVDAEGIVDVNYINSRLKDNKLQSVLDELLKINIDGVDLHLEVQLLKELAVRKRLIRLSSDWLNELTNIESDFYGIMDSFESTLSTEISTLIGKHDNDIKSAMIEMLENLQVKSGLQGVPSGFVDLDKLTLGWQRGSLITLASRPGMGKTSLAINFMLNSALSFGFGVAFFSMELNIMNLMSKIIGSISTVDQFRLRSKNLREVDWERLVTETRELAKSQIYIDDSPGHRIVDLKSKIRSHVRLNDVQLVIIDNSQLIVQSSSSPSNDDSGFNSFSMELRALAKELNIAIMVLCNLDRKLETRGGDKRPQLDDLPSEEFLEDFSDLILFLYRSEYYGITQDENGMPTKDLSEVIIAKNRMGSYGTVRLNFDANHAKFSDYKHNNSLGNSEA